MTVPQHQLYDQARVRIAEAAARRWTSVDQVVVVAAAALLADLWRTSAEYAIAPDDWSGVADLSAACLDLMHNQTPIRDNGSHDA